MAAQEPDRQRQTVSSFTDGMPDVALVEVDFPGLGKVEVFGPGVTIVDDEFYFTPDPIATPLVLSAVVDVFTSDVPQDDRPLDDLFPVQPRRQQLHHLRELSPPSPVFSVWV